MSGRDLESEFAIHGARVSRLAAALVQDAAAGGTGGAVVQEPALGLAGRVVDLSEHPIAGAHVFAFRIVEGSPEPHALGTSRSGGQGTYRLPLEERGPWLVVALLAEHAPAIARVELSPDASATRVPDLVLTPGEGIAGMARAADLPAAGAHVNARLAGTAAFPDRLRAPIGGDEGLLELGWDGERAVRLRARTEADSQGRFELRGLEPGRHALGLTPVPPAPLALSVALAPSEQLAAAQVVSAPARGVHLFDALASVVLDLRDFPPDARSSSGQVFLSGLRDDGGFAEHPVPVRRGREATLRVPPGRALTLDLRLDGYEAVRLETRAGTAGTVVRVVVPRTNAIAVGGVTLVLAEGSPAPELVGVEFTAMDGERRNPPLRRRFEDGRLDVGELRPASYRLTLHEARAAEGVRCLSWHGIVDVPAGATVEVPVSFEPGAGLEIGVRDARGAFVPARVWVFREDEFGAWQPVSTTFLVETAENWIAQSDEVLPGPGVGRVEEVLVPGRYAVEADFPRHRRARREVVVAAGETRLLELELVPE